ncbi:sugar transporter [Moniliophthora roreri MCA 2997]|uniref:Sugar transporter n=1 Tax=Moniliophthora roreri (strain MCA 2997) TaxID=1381753 RepID=V2X9S1_MONRO|nr:sugar transporter [Moniliophthora roreri MCA 2997]
MSLGSAFFISEFGYDASLIAGLMAMPQWNIYFGNPSGSQLGNITASLYFPTLVLLPVISYLNDQFGRRVAIAVASSCIVFGAFIGCFAQNVAMMIAGRVIVGCGAYALPVSCLCLINEILHPRLRGIASALFTPNYSIGSIVASWFTFGTITWQSEWSWRLPLLFQALGPTFLLFGVIFMPESPRWLISQGRDAQALAILAKYHANGDRTDELVANEMLEIKSHIKAEGEVSTSWGALVKTPGNRRRMVVVTTVAAGAILNGSTILNVYLAPALRLVGVVDPSQLAGINGGMSIFSWVVAIAGALSVDSLGRRPLWLISTSSMFLTFAAMTGVAAGFTKTGDPSYGIAFIVMIFLSQGCYMFAWNPLSYSYPAECLTFTIRAKALAWFAWVQAACLVFSLYVNPIALEILGWKYYGVYVAVLGVLLLLIWRLFVETRGATIEQISVIFDYHCLGRQRSIDTLADEPEII